MKRLELFIIGATLLAALVWMTLFCAVVFFRSEPIPESVCGRRVEKAFRAEVVRIVDGDTIELAGFDKTFRFASVDTPEPDQPFGPEAGDAIAYLVGEVVQVYQVQVGRWGRPVAFFELDGVNINADQVRRGLAWHDTRYSSDEQLETMENDARNEGRGLWQQPDPIAPWDWRN